MKIKKTEGKVHEKKKPKKLINPEKEETSSISVGMRERQTKSHTIARASVSWATGSTSDRWGQMAGRFMRYGQKCIPGTATSKSNLVPADKYGGMLCDTVLPKGDPGETLT